MYRILLYLRIDVCVVDSCESCPVISDLLVFVLLSGRIPALLASLYFVSLRKRRVATYNYICMLIRTLYLYAEPIVEPLLLQLYSSCAILQNV